LQPNAPHGLGLGRGPSPRLIGAPAQFKTMPYQIGFSTLAPATPGKGRVSAHSGLGWGRFGNPRSARVDTRCFFRRGSLGGCGRGIPGIPLDHLFPRPQGGDGDPATMFRVPGGGPWGRNFQGVGCRNRESGGDRRGAAGGAVRAAHRPGPRRPPHRPRPSLLLRRGRLGESTRKGALPNGGKPPGTKFGPRPRDFFRRQNHPRPPTTRPSARAGKGPPPPTRIGLVTQGSKAQPRVPGKNRIPSGHWAITEEIFGLGGLLAFSGGPGGGDPAGGGWGPDTFTEGPFGGPSPALEGGPGPAGAPLPCWVGDPNHNNFGWGLGWHTTPTTAKLNQTRHKQKPSQSHNTHQIKPHNKKPQTSPKKKNNIPIPHTNKNQLNSPH